MQLPTLKQVPPLYHGTNSINYKSIQENGFDASTSGFGQSLLSGLGLLPVLSAAQSYADSKVKWEGGEPIVIEVQLPAGRWADLRGRKLPQSLLEALALENGIDPNNFADFRRWYEQYKSLSHPLSLTRILLEMGFDGAVIDSTLGKKHPAPEYVWFRPNHLTYHIVSYRENPHPPEYYAHFYQEMFKNLPLRKEYIDSMISLAVGQYRKRDKITYILRLHRYYDSKALLIDGDTSSRVQRVKARELNTQEKEHCNKVIRTFERKYGEHSHEEIEEYLIKFEHFNEMALSHQIQDMLRLEWQNQSPQSLLGILQEMEDEYLNSLKDSDRNFIPDDEEELIIDFNDNYYWVMLNSSSSDEEAQSMGHCGSISTDGWLLSLRSKGTNGMVRSHLTFAWHPVDIDAKWTDTWGVLAEMKGYKNSKPTVNYHKYIMMLLKLPQIQRIVKADYKPESDFALKDLDPEPRKQLLKEKPQLDGWQYLPAGQLLEYLNKGCGLKLSLAGDLLLIESADNTHRLVEELMPILSLSMSHKQLNRLKSAIKLLNGEQQFQSGISSDYHPNLKDWLHILEEKVPELYLALTKKINNNEIDKHDLTVILINSEQMGWESGTLDEMHQGIHTFLDRIVWKIPLSLALDQETEKAQLFVHYKDFAKALNEFTMDDISRLDQDDLENLFLQIETVPYFGIDEQFDSKAALETFQDLIRELL